MTTNPAPISLTAEQRAYLESYATCNTPAPRGAAHDECAALGLVAITRQPATDGTAAIWDLPEWDLTDAGLALLSSTAQMQPTFAVLRARVRTHIVTARRDVSEAHSWAMSDWREGTMPTGGGLAFTQVRDNLTSALRLLDSAAACVDRTLQYDA